jgi:outer membrane protein
MSYSMNFTTHKKALFFLLITATFAHVAQAQQAKTLTLQQCVQTAIANNVDARQSDLKNQSAEANLKQAKAGRLPSVSGDINHGMNQGRSIDPFTNSYITQGVNFANYGLNASITLFNGGSISNNIKQNAYSYEATKMDLQQNKDNITLQVILAYLQVLSNEDLLQQNKNQLALSEKQVERLEILDKDGAVKPSELYDLKGQYANDELSIIASQNQLNASKLSLSQLMNIPFDKDMQLERLDIQTDVQLYDGGTQMIYELAAKQMGFVKATEYRKLSASKAVLAAKGLLYPTVYLSGGLYTNYSSVASTATLISTANVPSGDYVDLSGNKVPVITTQSNYESSKIGYFNQFKNNYNTSVGIGIRVPIFNGLQARTRVTQAKLDLKNAELVEETTKIQLRQNIEQANFNMEAAYARYQKLTEQVASFKESFRIADVRFNAGAITSVDYLVAKNNLDRSNINFIIAKYEYLIRTKVLDYYQGKSLW